MVGVALLYVCFRMNSVAWVMVVAVWWGVVLGVVGGGAGYLCGGRERI